MSPPPGLKDQKLFGCAGGRRVLRARRSGSLSGSPQACQPSHPGGEAGRPRRQRGLLARAALAAVPGRAVLHHHHAVHHRLRRRRRAELARAGAREFPNPNPTPGRPGGVLRCRLLARVRALARAVECCKGWRAAWLSHGHGWTHQDSLHARPRQVCSAWQSRSACSVHVPGSTSVRGCDT